MTEIHMILLAAVIQLLTALVAYQYISHRVDGQCRIKAMLKPVFEFKCLVVMLIAFFVAMFVFLREYLLDNDPSFTRAIMNAEVFLWLTVLGYVDLREKIIPNHMIGIGLLFWLVLMILEIVLAKTYWKDLLMFSVLGGAICGGVLLVIALIVKTALGMGDVKMFFVLGLLYGVTDTYGILLFSMVIMGVISILLLLTKKVTTKTAIPMAPFVVIGFLLSILAGM